MQPRAGTGRSAGDDSGDRARWALQERVKELTCLYGIAKVAQERDRPVDELLDRIVRLLPSGWQYPEDCEARIRLDGRDHRTPGFAETPWMQTAEVRVGACARGRIDVAYATAKPVMQEGVFLAEERSLIDEVARQVGMILEGRAAQEEQARLREQLLHAERLATIGKLTAGVAHELNEPLGSILGFAQLVLEGGGVSEEARRDLDRIEYAALHAREIVKKLMFFGRQTPPGKAAIDLNQVVTEGIGFLELRFAKLGIRLVRRLERELPRVVADPGQMQQVLVNLTVNAMQAMPEGGELVLSTRRDGDDVVLAVEDTGIGMSQEVQAQIFEPFFSTKDAGEGIGLGLSVVDGIVTAHGGTIEVASEPGRGSCFEVRLPAAREEASK